jgi:hypothetical protein
VPTFGSDGGFQADNRGGIIDSQGNTIISADDSFGASPLGVAARTQALYGIPNANFNLTPPEPAEPIVANQNDLPYWSVTDESGGDITATSVFDATTQTYGVEINPGTADNGSVFRLSTRSYLLTDDSLALRQKAQAVLAKSGTAAGTSQWALTLDCVYYDANDTALSTAVIGTALDTGTWTSLAGTTTPGGSAINASAQYVDLTFTLTTTAEVTGSAKATLKSLLLTTSVAGGGGSQSFLVTETFTANDTWNRPTGVEYLVAAVAAGAGGGGGSGQIRARSGSNTANFNGAAGGAGGNWWLIRDLYIGDQSSISIGIGSGGAGGTAQTYTKAGGVTPPSSNIDVNGAAGADGGSTTLGSYATVFGGRGATAATGDGATGPAGGAAGSATTTAVWGASPITAGVGGRGGGNGGGSAASGSASEFSPYTVIPYSPAAAAGTSGAASTGTGATHTAGAAGTSTAGLSGGGGASGGGVARGTSIVGASGAGAYGGGGAGGSRAIWHLSGTVTITATGGDGGDAVNEGGGGGGGSIALASSSGASFNASTINFTTGAGGDGSNGFVTLVYIA